MVAGVLSGFIVRVVVSRVLTCGSGRRIMLILRAVPHGNGRHAPQWESGQRKNQEKHFERTGHVLMLKVGKRSGKRNTL